MDHEQLADLQKAWHGTLKSYLIGLVGSLVLTFAAYFFVTEKWLHGIALMVFLGILALAQAIIQLIFFLHIGTEAKPKWETMVFCFMVMVLFILVLGTLWIMYDLDNRVMGGMSMGGIKP